eukprot:CCRYP_006436-RA/>CCRYP_006436-RA protein AED:0.41 eAED:0.51 QI:0/0/0/1/0/0/3/0/110
MGDLPTSLPPYLVGLIVFGATTQGNLFHAIGGGHLTDDNVFLALEKKKVKAEIKQVKTKKDVLLKMGDVAANANVKGLSGMKKDAMVSKWKHILESKKAAPACDCWSDGD